MEGFTLALSADNYHDEIPIENLIKLRSRAYFSTAKFNTERFQASISSNPHSISILHMGRASKWFSEESLRTPLIPSELDIERDDLDDETLILDEIYINAKGQILPNCDLSYERQDDYVLGTVLESDWIEKLCANIVNIAE